MDKVNPTLQEYERKPDFNTKHRPDFNPRKYNSIQYRVNSDKEFEISYMDKLISGGWYKLQDNRSILSEEMKGRHFKYRLNGKSLSGAEKGVFRSGGMVVGPGEGDKIGKYVMYKAYNGCLFPLQLGDVLEIYTKDPNIKIEGSKKDSVISKTVFFAQPAAPTGFPISLVSNLNGENVIIFYGRDNYSQTRFIQSKKYEYALRTGDWDISINKSL